MESVSLTALADEHLEPARAASAGRSGHIVHGGRDQRLRHTLIALVSGRRLGEHETGEATLQVVRDTVRLHAGPDTWDGAVGDLVEIPPTRHDVAATEDAAVLLTVALGTRAPA